MNLESNCSASSFNTSCDPTSLSCYFVASLSKSKAVKLNHFNTEEKMKAAFSRADLRATIKVEFSSLQHQLSFTVGVSSFMEMNEILWNVRKERFCRYPSIFHSHFSNDCYDQTYTPNLLGQF